MYTTLFVISIVAACTSLGSISGYFLAAAFRSGNNKEEDQRIYEKGFADGKAKYHYIVVSSGSQKVGIYETYTSALYSTCFENANGWEFDDEKMIIYIYDTFTQVMDYYEDAYELCAQKDREDEKAYLDKREHERSESERIR